MTVDLTAQQLRAVHSVQDWFRSGNVDRPYYLAGYAGTGKTTLARYIVESLGLETVRYGAYTGKAAHVLRSKGAEPATTLHSLIYLPRVKARERLRELEREREQLKLTEDRTGHRAPERDRWLMAQIRAEKERLASPDFLLLPPQQSSLHGCQLLVIDECSMVDSRMASDLDTFGVPLLVLGDPAQLPPVVGEGHYTGRAPDTLLTEVHRSALDSPVTRAATTVRSAEPGQRGYGLTWLSPDGTGRLRDLPVGALPQYDQVLAGTNRTRWQAISLLRRMAGVSSRYQARPVTGDKIIILANNGEADVFNGQQFTVDSVRCYGRTVHELVVAGDDNGTRELSVYATGFRGSDGESQARLRQGRGQVAAATFAQCVTVHKAQGSQWDRVLVLDESHVFERMARGSATDRYRAGQRWLYTAVTRAMDTVTVTGTGVVRD